MGVPKKKEKKKKAQTKVRMTRPGFKPACLQTSNTRLY
jgi:hypothetical protein